MPAAGINRIRKIAMVGREWVRVYARLLAGGLQYANDHPNEGILIQPFTKSAPAAKLMADIERWGAEGIYGLFSDELLREMKAAMRRPIPIVNHCVSTACPGVVNVINDSDVFCETAVEHFRQLGLKYFGYFCTGSTPSVAARWLPKLKQLTSPNDRYLTLPIPEPELMNPRASGPVTVPEALATWLRELPKPIGVICVSLGSGRYLIQCCAKLGLKVPGDIAIIGCDDMDVSLSCTPTLTSMVANTELVGGELVRILVQLMNGTAPPTPVVRLKAMDLEVRESTGQQRPAICDIAGALEYIKANATKGITVTQLMHETQRTSEPTFYQSFYKATGKTPSQAIRDRQLEEAKRLLTTTQLPVGMIADMSGFSRSDVMARVFQRVEGMTPLEYRKQSTKA